MSKIVLRTINREINVRGHKQTEWAVEIRQLTDSDLDHDDVIICPCSSQAYAKELAQILAAAIESYGPAQVEARIHPECDEDAFDPDLGDLGVLAAQPSNRKAGRS